MFDNKIHCGLHCEHNDSIYADAVVWLWHLLAFIGLLCSLQIVQWSYFRSVSLQATRYKLHVTLQSRFLIARAFINYFLGPLILLSMAARLTTVSLDL